MRERELKVVTPNGTHISRDYTEYFIFDNLYASTNEAFKEILSILNGETLEEGQSINVLVCTHREDSNVKK